MPQVSRDSKMSKYQEEWKVILSSKGRYTLGTLQAKILRQEIANHSRGIVMFETFAIPIPHIVEFYRVRRFLKGARQLPARASELPYKPIPREKFEQFKKKAYKAIGKKYEKNS